MTYKSIPKHSIWKYKQIFNLIPKDDLFWEGADEGNTSLKIIAYYSKSFLSGLTWLYYDGSITILCVYIDKNYRNKGIGTKLIKCIINKYKKSLKNKEIGYCQSLHRIADRILTKYRIQHYIDTGLISSK